MVYFTAEYKKTPSTLLKKRLIKIICPAAWLFTRTFIVPYFIVIHHVIIYAPLNETVPFHVTMAAWKWIFTDVCVCIFGAAERARLGWTTDACELCYGGTFHVLCMDLWQAARGSFSVPLTMEFSKKLGV